MVSERCQIFSKPGAKSKTTNSCGTYGNSFCGAVLGTVGVFLFDDGEGLGVWDSEGQAGSQQGVAPWCSIIVVMP